MLLYGMAELIQTKPAKSQPSPILHSGETSNNSVAILSDIEHTVCKRNKYSKYKYFWKQQQQVN